MDRMRTWSLKFDFPAGRSHVRFFFFGRTGGRSAAPLDGLNLGMHSGDEEENVRANEALVLKEMGIEKLFLPTQVHGTAVTVLDRIPVIPVTRGESADAVVTVIPGVAVGVLTADCVPILIADSQGRAVAAVHAGWRGLANGVVEAAIGNMRNFLNGTDGLVAYVGPAIGPCCYEVDQDLARRFERDVAGGAGASSNRGSRPTLDLALVAARQLQRSGLSAGTVKIVRRCTSCENAVFFSHRRDKGKTGRQLSAAVIFSHDA
jgi:polyphenol oxidase